MKRDFLTNLGLDDEQVNKIMAEHGKTVNSLKDELDKAGDYQTQVEDLQTQLKERDTQLEGLSNKAKGNEDLTKQIEQLKEQNKQTAKEYQDKLDKQTFEFALEKALSTAKARNPKAVKALLDIETIKLDGDKLLGLEEQLKSLQESDAYLFDDGEPAGLKGRTPHPSDPSKQQKGLTKEQFDQMSYTDKLELYNSNFELYQQLSK